MTWMNINKGHESHNVNKRIKIELFIDLGASYITQYMSSQLEWYGYKELVGMRNSH